MPVCKIDERDYAQAQYHRSQPEEDHFAIFIFFWLYPLPHVFGNRRGMTLQFVPEYFVRLIFQHGYETFLCNDLIRSFNWRLAFDNWLLLVAGLIPSMAAISS